MSDTTGGLLIFLGVCFVLYIVVTVIRAKAEQQRRRETFRTLTDSAVAQLERTAKGVPNEIDLGPISLRKGEVAYFSVPMILREEKVVARRYTGGSRGVSFRIAKGVSYRVGGYRGYSTPVRDFVVAAVGNLIVSNQRLIFQGDNQSFSAAWEKVMNYVNEDGFLKVTIDNRAKPRLLEFLGDYQPVEVMLAYAQKHRFISEAPAGKSAERIERPSAAATTAKSQPQ